MRPLPGHRRGEEGSTRGREKGGPISVLRGSCCRQTGINQPAARCSGSFPDPRPGLSSRGGENERMGYGEQALNLCFQQAGDETPLQMSTWLQYPVDRNREETRTSSTGNSADAHPAFSHPDALQGAWRRFTNSPKCFQSSPLYR